MALTDAEVCNLALAKIGEKGFIDALSDDTEAAEICNVLYATSRDAMLEAHPWPFATHRELIGLLASRSVDDSDVRLRTGWSYTYALPSDMLPNGQRYLETGLPNPAPDQQIPFVIEDDVTEGKAVLITNQPLAELVYTFKLTNVAKMSPLFQEALSWKLAYELTLALPVKSSLGLGMIQGFDRAFARAAASVSKHMTPSQPPKPSAIRARAGR